MNMENIWLNDNGIEFLLFSYFGITKNELEKDDEATKEKIVKKCAERAYRDMCRTLKFISDSDENRKAFRKDIYCIIVRRVNNDLFQCNDENFDNVHHEICNDIIIKANESKILQTFSYGQAQKWLNMTIKYMRMFNCFIKLMNDNDLENKLHVPVDAYIITKAKEEFGIMGPRDPWSKWDEKKYKNFQDNLRKAIKHHPEDDNGTQYKSPIEWEEKAWIEIAKKKRAN